MKRIILSTLLLASIGLHAETYTVDVKQRYQTNEGWGVSLCWWANMCGRWNDERVSELVDWLVSPEGLNYNIFRYNIGGGDDPNNGHCLPHHMGKGKGLRAEMEGFKDGPDEPYDWEADEAQRRIMLMIKEKRPDAIFEAFSNSAPWWMTISGCVGGNTPATADNLRPDCYVAFAQYLVDVCKHYKETYGIEFVSLEPFNEPVTDYWYANGSQEGCHFGAEAQTDFVKILSPLLKESGLNTIISASDETNVETSIQSLKVYRDKGVLPLIGRWNTHTYSGSIEAKKELQQLTSELGIKFWQSETGSGGRGIHGNLMMAQRLMDDIRYMKPAAWHRSSVAHLLSSSQLLYPPDVQPFHPCRIYICGEWIRTYVGSRFAGQQDAGTGGTEHFRSTRNTSRADSQVEVCDLLSYLEGRERGSCYGFREEERKTDIPASSPEHSNLCLCSLVYDQK